MARASNAAQASKETQVDPNALRTDYQNSFHLVVVASQRAKQLAAGARPRVEPGEHTHVRVALLEVVAGMISWSITEKVPAAGAPLPQEP
jgi:DNA-directed RNA polymerase omega subunit